MNRSLLVVLIGVGLIAGCSSVPTYDYDEVDVKPKPVYTPKPEYPEEARKKGWEGTVIIEALVDIDGTVADVNVTQSSGYRILDKAAKEAARDWEFIPGEHEGELVRVLVSIPFSFVMD